MDKGKAVKSSSKKPSSQGVTLDHIFKYADALKSLANKNNKSATQVLDSAYKSWFLTT